MNPLASFLDLIDASIITSDVDLDQNDRPVETITLCVNGTFLEELALALGLRPRWGQSIQEWLEAAVKEDIAP